MVEYPDQTLLRFRDDEPHDEPAVTLDSFIGQSNAAAVRLKRATMPARCCRRSTSLR